MKTFLVFVTTIDGKVTRWGDPFVRAWSSKEDQDYFFALIKNSPLVVLGSKTYNADPIKAKPGRLIKVMTSNPDLYSKLRVSGQLEFTDESPARLVEEYRNKGYKEMLVAGGPQVATSFLKEHLIDEIWLTLEPLVFGSGGNFVTEEKLDIQLQLISYNPINDRGTVILKYKVKS